MELAVEWGLFTVLAAVAAFAVVAVPLGMVGHFRWYAVLPLTAIAAGLIGVAVRRPPFRITAGRWPTWFVLATIGAVTALGMIFPTYHYSTNRDPGIYATTGLWLAREGSILIDAPAEPFQGLLPDVTNRAAGFYGHREDLKLYPQFAHLTHSYLGAATFVGGPPLLARANVLAAAAGMLALFVLAQQLARGWPAALATAAVAVSLPQVYFSRGPYSEPLAQLCVIGALAMLVSSRQLKPSVAALAGLLLGAAIGSRIDGVLILVGLVGALVVWRIQERSGPTTMRSGGAFVAGFVLTGGIGIVDVRLFSPGYFGDLWPRYRSALILAIAVVLVGLVVILVKERVAAVPRWFARWRRPLVTAVPLVLALGLLWAWLLRPEMIETRGPEYGLIGGLQDREGVPVDAGRAYGEDTLVWFSWYFGAPILLAAIAGAAVLARRGLEGREWRAAGVGAILGVPTLVYLWTPNITPDQVWAMRRFLPTGVPVVATLAAVGLSAGLRLVNVGLERRPVARLGHASARSLIVGAVAVAMLAPPLATTAPFWDHQEVRFSYGDLRNLCEAIDGRPVLIDDAQTGGHRLVQSVISACDVPAARVTTEAMPEVAPLLADRWSDAGEDMVLISLRDLSPVIDGVELENTVGLLNREIERTVEEPPDSLEPGTTAETFGIYVFSGGRPPSDDPASA